LFLGPGEIFKNPGLARVLKEIQKEGKRGFYEGWVANEIIKAIQEEGGSMTLEDLKNHSSIIEDPVSINYKGYTVYEIGPNSQGITALIALNILESFDLKSMGHNSSEYLHVLIEALRIAFSDTRHYVCDPDAIKNFEDGKIVERLLDKNYAKERSKLILKEKNNNIQNGYPISSSDTVYFGCVDEEGNACSFVNSNYMGFGTCIVPKGCGFSLQNRGANFSLKKGHLNCY
jgi:gamma-glutamyltranspeptidase/glutathione hydrolase